jgi:hypothetical protein
MAMAELDYFDSKRRRVFVDDEDEDEDALKQYFATYDPISNLPTPPLSSTSSPISVLDTPDEHSVFTGKQ